MLTTPTNEFELISKKMQQIVSYGKSKNTKRVINWRISENNGTKHIKAYQLGGASINLTIVPSINGLHELVDFSHEGKFQQSVDLLATILEHKGSYHQSGDL